ncbi:MAG: cache domain-containing protein [Candidatus Aureabacteria bacterium]|nr:cache domain-containing protein [Candidatus Auribacterota bacterium]
MDRRFSRRGAVSPGRLVGLAVASALGGIAYFAWLNHYDFERALIAQSQQLLLTIARSEAQSLGEYIGDIQQEMEILSSNAVLRKAFAEGRRQTSGETQAALDDSYRDVENLVDVICMIDRHGVVIRSSPARESTVGQDLSQTPDIAAALAARKAYISGIFRLPSGVRAVAFSQPVFEDKVLIGLMRAVLSVERINDLITHINQSGLTYAFVRDEHGMLVSYPDAALLGMDMAVALQGRIPRAGVTALREEIGAMGEYSEGTNVILLPTAGVGPEIVQTIVAFTPVRIGVNMWSIAVAMDCRMIAGPLHRNVRDNLVFVCFVFGILGILLGVMYRIRKKRVQLATSTRALDIINRQLHLEIDERRRIERALHESMRTRGRKPR